MKKIKKKSNKTIKNPQYYKFTSVETLDAILQEDNGFRFSSIADLNDAFESVDIDKKEVENYRTLSFTRSHSSVLMWAHYANNFNGCVVQLRKEKYQNIEFKQVRYLSREERQRQYPDYKKLLIKGPAWIYEKEHRVIININNLSLDDIVFDKNNFYLKPYIKHIYFGPGVKDTREYLNILEKVDTWNNLAIKERRKTKDEIKISKYMISENSYELIPIKNFDYKKEIERLLTKIK